MVQPRELAEQLNRVIIVSNSRVLLVIKTADVNCLTVVHNLGSPLSALIAPENAFITACAVRDWPLIERVLLRCAQPKVGFAIIQAVVIDMVAVHAGRSV